MDFRGIVELIRAIFHVTKRSTDELHIFIDCMDLYGNMSRECKHKSTQNYECPVPRFTWM